MGIITEELKKAGFEVVNEGIKALWNPDDEALDRCVAYGRELGAQLSAPQQ